MDKLANLELPSKFIVKAKVYSGEFYIMEIFIDNQTTLYICRNVSTFGFFPRSHPNFRATIIRQCFIFVEMVLTSEIFQKVI